jgi:hypothetical protein
MENIGKNEERVFSIELKSKIQLKNFHLSNGSPDSILIEGTLGELMQATFADEIILEIVGKDGVLRINLGKQDIEKSLKKRDSKDSGQTE